jgi:hypothetical protein
VGAECLADLETTGGWFRWQLNDFLVDETDGRATASEGLHERSLDEDGDTNGWGGMVRGSVRLRSTKSHSVAIFSLDERLGRRILRCIPGVDHKLRIRLNLNCRTSTI